jgi:hypothetical protein
MSGMEPILIGAALGGGISAAQGKDPLKGALIGGVTGGVGGSFASGFTGAAGTPAAGIMGSGAGYAGNAMATAPTFMQQVGGGLSGVGSSLGGVNSFMNANPVTSQIGFGLAKDALTPEQPQYAPAGQIQRGQFNPVDYMSLLNPQSQPNQQNQYAQQPISLL